jgi:hypothetical protein
LISRAPAMSRITGGVALRDSAWAINKLRRMWPMPIVS